MTSSASRLLSNARRLLVVLAPFVAGAVAACGDPLRSRASLETFTDTLTVYALSDTAAARRDYPTALLTTAQTADVNGQVVVQPRVVSAAGTADFDVAFDLNSAGDVVIIPQRRLVPATAGRSIGLRTVEETFEDLSEAPRTGYQFDTLALVVPTKKTVVIQTQASACFNDVRGDSPYTFAKLVVDAIDQPTRAISFRIVVDPNCGFRSFRPGVPGR